MAENTNAVAKYENCSRYKRKQPITKLDEAITSSYLSEFRVLPLFEKRLYDRSRITHYSLNTNELLACRWKMYLDTTHERIPFKFPRIEDFHFYKYHLRYEPSQSLGRIDPRRRLGLGNLLDTQHLPIPNDMQFRKTIRRKRKHNKNYKNAIHGLWRVAADEGVLRLRAGDSMTCSRAVLMTIGQLSFYDQIKELLLVTEYFSDNFVTHVTSSLLAGAIATTTTQPVDVLKTEQ